MTAELSIMSLKPTACAQRCVQQCSRMKRSRSGGQTGAGRNGLVGPRKEEVLDGIVVCSTGFASTVKVRLSKTQSTTSVPLRREGCTAPSSTLLRV